MMPSTEIKTNLHCSCLISPATQISDIPGVVEERSSEQGLLESPAAVIESPGGGSKKLVTQPWKKIEAMTDVDMNVKLYVYNHLYHMGVNNFWELIFVYADNFNKRQIAICTGISSNYCIHVLGHSCNVL